MRKIIRGPTSEKCERYNITPQGYALIEYETFKEGQNALDALDGEDLLGQPLAVNWAFSKGPAKKKKR